MGSPPLRPERRTRRLGLAAAVLAPVVLLCACDEQTYPTAANTEAPPPAPAQELMGAPEGAPPTAEVPPATAEVPPPPPAPYASMAPIPNPGARGSEPYYEDRRVHGRYGVADEAPVEAAPAPRTALRRHRRPRVYAAATAAPAVRAPAPQIRPSLKAGPAPTPYPGTRTAAAKAPLAAAPAAGDPAQRLAALSASLTPVFARTAVLAVPANLKADTPVDVSLTVPEGFFAKLKDQAAAQGVADMAASASLTAKLAGSGYGVMPAEPQTQPLASGRGTVFHWVVTPAPGGRGPLQAEVSTTLLGDGAHVVPLGSVRAGASPSGMTFPRVLGASLLILIGAGVLAWLFRARNPSPTTSAFARRHAIRTAPPLDLSPDPPPKERI